MASEREASEVDVQFCSDIDGDLMMFPADLGERDYINRWRVWVVRSDGTRHAALVDRPIVCVDNNGRVTNPYGTGPIQNVAGWNVDDFNASDIEVSIDDEPPIRIGHPRAR